MSNTYVQACVSIGETQEHHDWIDQALTACRRVIEAAPYGEDVRDEDRALTEFVVGEHYSFNHLDYVGFDIERDQDEGRVYTILGGEECVNCLLMGRLIQAFLKHFKLKDTITFTYCCTTDCLVPDGFGGGIYIVRAEGIYATDVEDLRDDFISSIDAGGLELS